MANGEPMTGVDAAKKGLVDETGYFDDAVTKARALAKLATAKVVTYRQPPSLLDFLVSDVKAPPLPLGRASLSEEAIFDPYPKLYYMWTVGRDFILSSDDGRVVQPAR